jgi:hypothetical protein
MAMGFEQLINKEGTEKTELQESPLSKYSRFGVYSMNKTEGRRGMFV